MSVAKGIEPCKGSAPTDDLPSQMPLGVGDNLLLRFGRPDDREAWEDFARQIWWGNDSSRHWASPWSSDLWSGSHPTCKPSDFTLVEDVQAGKVVSSMCIIPQTWSYGGIPFGCGQVELVATVPAYRQRGLVRKQFEVIHALGDSRGELMQCIRGINWFYSQFGYEKALNAGGTRVLYHRDLSTAKESEEKAYHLREAQTRDRSFIREVYEYASRRYILNVVRSPELWDYEFTGRSEDSKLRREWLIIERTGGEPLGYVQYRPDVPNIITQIELKPGVGYLNLTPTLLHSVWMHSAQLHPDGGMETLDLRLGHGHPIYPLLPKNPTSHGYHNWYVHIPDVVAFLRHIRSALEANLVGTIAEGYSGELTLSFYWNAIELKFERGKITDISWLNRVYVWGESTYANFPDLTFWQLVCGRRSFRELAEAFPDQCCGTTEAGVLLDCLFPKFAGVMWAVM